MTLSLSPIQVESVVRMVNQCGITCRENIGIAWDYNNSQLDIEALITKAQSVCLELISDTVNHFIDSDAMTKEYWFNKDQETVSLHEPEDLVNVLDLFNCAANISKELEEEGEHNDMRAYIPTSSWIACSIGNYLGEDVSSIDKQYPKEMIVDAIHEVYTKEAKTSMVVELLEMVSKQIEQQGGHYE